MRMLQVMTVSGVRQLSACVALARVQGPVLSRGSGSGHGTGTGTGTGTGAPRRLMSSKTYNVPPSGEFVARVSGIATMAKLPYQDTAEGLDAAFIGVPLDTGTSNRPGTRFTHTHITVSCHVPSMSYQSGSFYRTAGLWMIKLS